MLWSSGLYGSKQMLAITASVGHELKRARTRRRKLVWGLKRHLRALSASVPWELVTTLRKGILINAALLFPVLSWRESSGCDGQGGLSAGLCLLPAEPRPLLGAAMSVPGLRKVLGGWFLA